MRVHVGPGPRFTFLQANNLLPPQGRWQEAQVCAPQALVQVRVAPFCGRLALQTTLRLDSWHPPHPRPVVPRGHSDHMTDSGQIHWPKSSLTGLCCLSLGLVVGTSHRLQRAEGSPGHRKRPRHGPCCRCAPRHSPCTHTVTQSCISLSLSHTQPQLTVDTCKRSQGQPVGLWDALC